VESKAARGARDKDCRCVRAGRPEGGRHGWMWVVPTLGVGRCRGRRQTEGGESSWSTESGWWWLWAEAEAGKAAAGAAGGAARGAECRSRAAVVPAVGEGEG
jgi:hypothetical protein